MSQSFSLPNPIITDIPTGYCNDPFGLNYKIDGNLASLSWTSPHDNDGFYLNYWITGEAPVQVTVFGTNIQLPLLPGVTYNWSVRTMCNRGGNIGSTTVIGPPFTTGQEGLTCGIIDISSALVIKTGKAARVEWTAIPGILSYTVELKYGTMMPMSFAVSTNYLNLAILLPNTEYQWRVKPVCPNKVVNFSDWASFKTLLGDTCPQVDIQGIVDVTTAIYYWTNCEASRSYQVYLNGSLIAAEHPVNIITFNHLLRLTEYTIIVIPNCPAGPGEMAFLTTNTKDYPIKNPTNLAGGFSAGNLNITWIPAPDITGQEIMINGSYLSIPADQNSYSIVAPPPNSKISALIKSVNGIEKSPGSHIILTTPGYCQPITEVSINEITSNSVQISWPLTTRVSKYRVRRRLANGATWVTDYTTSTEYTFKGLKANTDYILEVLAVCGSDNSDSFSYSVKTNPVSECPIPVELSASEISATSAVVDFKLSDGKVPYNGQYVIIANDGVNPVIYQQGSQAPILIQGLLPFTNYTITAGNMCLKPDFNFPTSLSESIDIKTLKACAPVTGLAAALQTNNTEVYTSWVAAAGATGYTVFYRQLGALDWIEHSTANTINRTISITKQALYDIKVVTNYGDTRSCYAMTTTPAPKVLNLSNPDGGYRSTLIWDEILGVDGYLVTISSLSSTFTVTAINSALKILLDPDTNYNVYVQAFYANAYGVASDAIDFNTGNPDYSEDDDLCENPPEVEAFYQDSNINTPAVTAGTKYDVAIKIKNYDRNLRYEIQILESTSTVPVTSRIIEAGDPNFNGTAIFNYLPYLTYNTVVYTFGTSGLLCDVIEPVRSTACDKPINLASDNITDTSFTITWDASSGALGYNIYINGEYEESTLNTFLDITEKIPDTEYKITIAAQCGTLLVSPISDELTVTTNPAP